MNSNQIIVLPTRHKFGYLSNEMSRLLDFSFQVFYFVRYKTLFFSDFTANQFVDTCLKTTLPSIIQIYEFKTDVKLNYEYGTSCRFSILPNALPLRTSKVEKRGKIVVFEESLKAFHASKDVPFLSKIGL